MKDLNKLVRIPKNITKQGYSNLTKATLLVVISLVALITVSPYRDEIKDSLSAIYASILVTLTNRDRLSQNIAELKVNPLLEKAAQLKADDMASKGYFSHNTPDGKTPWYFMDLAGYKYILAGENLAVRFQNSEDVQNAWMSSNPHRLNIVNPKFTEIGIATSTGIYKGETAIFVVQMFGNSNTR